MNTTAVNNPLPILPSAGVGKPTADAGNEPSAFGQALSQEISNRNEIDKNHSANSNKEASKNTSGTDAGKAKSADDTKTADKDKTTDDVIKKTEDKDVDINADNAAADIMAFVAHLTQNDKTASADKVDSKLTIADTLKKTAASSADFAQQTGKQSIKNVDSSEIAANSEDDIKTPKANSFLSALDKATAGLGDASKTKVATSTAETFAPILASTSPSLAPNSNALQRANELQNMQANTFAQQVGSADWDKALGQKVVWMVQGAQTSATMTLNPPDLGPMQITLNVNNNHATASFIAHHPDVRNALENAMPRLREMLGDAGIQLGQSNVSAGSSDQQAAFESGRQSSARQGSTNDSATVDPTLHVSHVRTPSASDGMVDTFA